MRSIVDVFSWIARDGFEFSDSMHLVEYIFGFLAPYYVSTRKKKIFCYNSDERPKDYTIKTRITKVRS